MNFPQVSLGGDAYGDNGILAVDFATGQDHVTPEPGYWALLSVGVAGLIWFKRRRVNAVESK